MSDNSWEDRSYDECFDAYCAQYKVSDEALLDLYLLKQSKPLEITSEFENATSHIMSDRRNMWESDKDRKKNLQKAYDHLVRAQIDSYKLMWLEYRECLKFGIAHPLFLFGVFANKSEKIRFVKDSKKIATEIRQEVEVIRRTESMHVGYKTGDSVDNWKAVCDKLENHFTTHMDYTKKYLKRKALRENIATTWNKYDSYVGTFVSTFAVALLLKLFGIIF